ncbi:MAG: family 20 glycosylhydrolase [Ginsengibacter sp.]
MKKIVLLQIVLCSYGSLLAQNKNLPLQIVPAVKEWKLQTGNFILTDQSKICVSNKDYSKIISQLNIFRNDVQTVFSKSLPITTVAQKEGDICFELKQISKKQEGSYSIKIDKKIIVEAAGYSGIWNAMQTLLQMLMINKNDLPLPAGTIEDYPSYPVRAMMLDVARKYFPLNILKQYIRFLAYLKYSELHLHFNDASAGGYSAFRIESKKFPELTAKDGFYTQQEIKDLQTYALQWGITIIPEFDSPGHAQCFTNIFPDLIQPELGANYLDILNKGTYSLMEKVFDEFVPLFSASDIHIGTDEYRLRAIKDSAKKVKYGEAFRNYINYFNRYLRKKGKRVRIWSGYEYMPGITQPDTNIVIDMWETDDGKAKADQGYKIINSSQDWTYLVPGAPYYGIDNEFVYDHWTPALFNTEKPENNLSENDPHLLGGKFHVWLDFGPQGYNMNEIARLVIPSMWVFSEKLWGTKASKNYEDFVKRYEPLKHIPNVDFTKRRLLSDSNGLVYTSYDSVFTLKNRNDFIALPFGTVNDNINLEYPWTLHFDVKTNDTSSKSVILSSRFAEIYANYVYQTQIGEAKKDTTITGVGIDRAVKFSTKPLTVFNGYRYSSVFDYQLPVNEWENITIVGEEGKTTLYVNGKFVESFSRQMLCPLDAIGNKKGESFIGELRNLRIYDRALELNEIDIFK